MTTTKKHYQTLLQLKFYEATNPEDARKRFAELNTLIVSAGQSKSEDEMLRKMEDYIAELEEEKRLNNQRQNRLKGFEMQNKKALEDANAYLIEACNNGVADIFGSLVIQLRSTNEYVYPESKEGEQELIKYLLENNLEKYVKIKKEINKAEIKKVKPHNLPQGIKEEQRVSFQLARAAGNSAS